MIEHIKCPHMHGPPVAVVHLKAYLPLSKAIARADAGPALQGDPPHLLTRSLCEKCAAQVIELLRTVGQ